MGVGQAGIPAGQGGDQPQLDRAPFGPGFGQAVPGFGNGSLVAVEDLDGK